MKYIVKLLVLIILLLPGAVSAEVKEIICEGTYNMGDGETPSVAESRALLQAKRVAIEQAGTYVASYAKVKNFQLTEDEIKIMASGIMEVTTLDKKRTVVGDGFHFWVKIKALVNSDKMEEMARKVKDKSTVEDYKKIQAAYCTFSNGFGQMRSVTKRGFQHTYSPFLAFKQGAKSDSVSFANAWSFV
jgi:hypothetical protein